VFFFGLEIDEAAYVNRNVTINPFFYWNFLVSWEGFIYPAVVYLHNGVSVL
jgi:hypothetical protein